jgi:hypothetical protein
MEQLILFENKNVRRVWNQDRWFFSIVDVCGVLTESTEPRKYWSVLKTRLSAEGFQLTTFCSQLKMRANDGKMRLTDCANTEGLLRIIQTIPSPKAEPFKRWLAKVGYERLQEIEDPELASQRMVETYRLKGYSDEWIGMRMRGIAVRDTLTDEWDQRGVDQPSDYAVLTAEISRATFGMTPSEYKDFKSLDKPGDNLRDHMNDLELIFTMLGEASTTEIARNDDAQGLGENRSAARRGGRIAGDAKEKLEKQTGRKVSVKDNFKQLPEAEKRKQLNGPGNRSPKD